MKRPPKKSQRGRARAPHIPEKRQPELVQIEKPIYGGAFLARVEGKAAFVPLTLPGEKARIRFTEEKRSYATAEVEEIVTTAPGRVVPGCRHFGVCGGCQYQHAGYAAQLALKQAILRETLERAGVPAPEKIAVLAGTDSQAWRYRNRVRLAFDAEGNAGYRARRSNALVPIAECPIAAPILVKAALSTSRVARRFSHSLRLTEISLFCNPDETALLASLYTTKIYAGKFEELARALVEAVPELKGAELVCIGGDSEKDRGHSPKAIARWGEGSISYRAAGFDYRVDHGAFFQVNRWLVDALVDRVTAGQSGKLAWDLFAGVGLFARKLTEGFERVIAVESAPAAIPALEQNLLGTGGSAVRALTRDFLRRSKGPARPEPAVPDLIVVDPPRTGLGEEVTALIAEMGAPALTYVSCDPATLARDLRMLLAAGYSIENLTLADLFPQTFHLETVAHLRRS